MMSWPQAWWLDYVFFWLLGLNHSLPERAFIHLHFPSGDLRLCCLLLENHHFFIGESWWIIYGPWLPAAFLQAAEEEYERVHGEKPGAPSPDAAGWEMLDGWMDGSISSTVSGSMNQIDFQDVPCFFSQGDATFEVIFVDCVSGSNKIPKGCCWWCPANCQWGVPASHGGTPNSWMVYKEKSH